MNPAITCRLGFFNGRIKGFDLEEDLAKSPKKSIKNFQLSNNILKRENHLLLRTKECFRFWLFRTKTSLLLYYMINCS
jgi:hypothetical protein